MKILAIGAFAGVLGLGFAARPSAKAARQGAETVPVKAMTLATVQVPRTVKADDQVLKAGTYSVRLTGEALKPAAGQTANLEQRVEFLQAGKVKGTSVASVVPASQIHEVERERVPAPGHSRVDVLKGNDYVRVWINKDGNSYLIHLPTTP